MFKEYDDNGKKPLPVLYDRGGTYGVIGTWYNAFIREVGNIIWKDVTLDKEDWVHVPDVEKEKLHRTIGVNELYNHMFISNRFLLIICYL